MAKHVLVIFNPAAKSQIQPEQWIGKLVEELNKDDEYLVSFYPTTAETQPEDLVSFFRPPLDLVIAAGGDGTVRFAMSALAKAKSTVPVAIFPLGTGNVLARTLGIVDDSFFADPLQGAYEYVKHGEARRMDMGMLNGEYFAGMAGAGPISDAFMTPPRNEKTRFKLMAYAKALIGSIAKPPRIFKITTAGKTFKVEAAALFIGNVQDMGRGAKVDFAALSDGYLDLHVVNPVNFKDYVALGFFYASGAMAEDSPEYVLRIKEALIELIPRQGVRTAFQNAAQKLFSFFSGKTAADPSRSDQIPCMMDGEEAGFTPMHLTIIPQAVTVWLPTAKANEAPIEEHHLEVA